MGPGDPSPTCVASDSIRLACMGSAGEALTTKTRTKILFGSDFGSLLISSPEAKVLFGA